jgi:Tol biopolymer transport system component
MSAVLRKVNLFRFFLRFFRVAVLILSGGYGCASADQTNFQINGFSPDNRYLSLDICLKSDCQAVLLDWRSGAYSRLEPSDPDQAWTSARFSPSGKYLAVAVKRRSDKFRSAQLGVFELKTKTLRVLTNTPTHKDAPSFSPDEKRLIFMYAGQERKSGKTRFSNWDIYELDIETGKERPLTNFKFFLIGRPHYLPDGKRFVFSGEGPDRFHGKVGIDAYYAYQEKYQDNTIFIRNHESAELSPAFVNGKHTNGPRITHDGIIAYVSITNEMDGIVGGYFNYDIFLYENGKHRRLTKLKTILYGMEISADGTLIAYVSDPKRDRNKQLFVMNVADGQPARIELPVDRLFDMKP